MDYDIFVCYNKQDKEAALELYEKLQKNGIRPWIDEKDATPGKPWQSQVEKVLARTPAVAVLVGASGQGPWQDMEIGAAIRGFVKRGASVIPVLLEGAPKTPDLPLFLADFVWVDLRTEPLSRLLQGIGSAKSSAPQPMSDGAGPPYKMILRALREGKVVLFLGSGAALCERTAGWKLEDTDLPGGDELARHLAEMSGVETAKASDTGALSWVSQCFEGVNKRPTLDDEIHGIYTRPENPGRLHRLLARFPRLVIVTLGWDRLLEAALREVGQPYHRVLYRLGESSVLVWGPGDSKPKEESPTDVDLELDEFPVVFQLYGVAETNEKERDRLIVTERDYAELVRSLPDALPSCFARPFKERHHLVLGCDLDAWSERIILDQMWQTWRRQRGAWAVHHPLPLLEREHWSREHDLTIIPVPLRDFVTQLEQEADSG